MRILLRAIPSALVATLAVILVPPILHRLAPGVRFDLFLPIVAFIATREPLYIGIPAAWILGAASDAVCGTPAGTGVFGFQIIVVGMHVASRWLSFRSAAGFGALLILLSAVNSAVQYLVLMIVGRKAVLEWWIAAPDALRTGLWGIAVYYLIGGAARLSGRLAGQPAEDRGTE